MGTSVNLPRLVSRRASQVNDHECMKNMSTLYQVCTNTYVPCYVQSWSPHVSKRTHRHIDNRLSETDHESMDPTPLRLARS